MLVPSGDVGGNSRSCGKKEVSARNRYNLQSMNCGSEADMYQWLTNISRGFNTEFVVIKDW